MVQILNTSINKHPIVISVFCSLITALSFGHFYTGTSTLFMLLIAAITSIGVHYLYCNPLSKCKPQIILSLFFALFVSIGRLIQLHNNGKVSFLDHDQLINVICTAGLWLFFYIIISAAFVFLVQKAPTLDDSASVKRPYIKIFLICWLIIFICYLPYFIGLYPGVVSNDSYNQIRQVLSLRAYSNAHPIAHTFLIWVCFKLGHLISFGNNTCVAIYTLCQMLFMSAVFSYVSTYILRKRAPKWFFIGTVAFFALLPVNGFFAVTMWKDFIFSCFLLLLIPCLIEVVQTKGEWFNQPLHFIWFFVLSMLISVFRSNGIMIVFLTLVSVLIFLPRKKLRFSLLAAASLVVVIAYQTILLPGLGIEQTSRTEALGIPMNQICRVAALGLDLTDEQQKMVDDLVGTDITEVYRPEGYDSIKFNPKYNASALDQDMGGYLKLWGNLLLKYPSVYFESYFCQTLGYWYPDIQNEITDAYVYENPNGIYEVNLIPGLREFISYELKPEKTYDNPFLWCLNNMAIYVWAAGLLIAYCFYKKKPTLIIVWMPLIAAWLSIMISAPVNHVSRYLYIFFIAMPLGIMISLFKSSENEVTVNDDKKASSKI